MKSCLLKLWIISVEGLVKSGENLVCLTGNVVTGSERPHCSLPQGDQAPQTLVAREFPQSAVLSLAQRHYFMEEHLMLHNIKIC